MKQQPLRVKRAPSSVPLRLGYSVGCSELRGLSPRGDTLREEEMSMLLMRRQHLEGFAEAARRHFEGQMCKHLIGTDFDSDPQLAWASSTLQAPEPATQEERAALLYDRALNYIDAVVGPRYEYEKPALGKAERLTVQDLSRWASDSRDAVLTALRALYPRKFHYAGEPQSTRSLTREPRRPSVMRSLIREVLSSSPPSCLRSAITNTAVRPPCSASLGVHYVQIDRGSRADLLRARLWPAHG